MRKLAFRYRRVKEIYNTYKNNVGGKLSLCFTLLSTGNHMQGLIVVVGGFQATKLQQIMAENEIMLFYYGHIFSCCETTSFITAILSIRSSHDVVEKLKGRRAFCLSVRITSHELLFSVDLCALLITAGCSNSAGNHVCEVLA